MVNQGEVYWVDLGPPIGSRPGYLRPYVVIQNDLFNHSRVNTVVICGMTSNLARAGLPGQVLLDAGEANLPRDSLVNATQLYTVNKSDLGPPIGRLSSVRTRGILDAIRLVLEPDQP